MWGEGYQARRHEGGGERGNKLGDIGTWGEGYQARRHEGHGERGTKLGDMREVGRGVPS